MIGKGMRIIAAWICLLAFPVFANESDWVRNTLATNLPSFLSANATSNANHFITLRPDRSVGIYMTGIGTNNATNNITIGVRGSIDRVFTNSFPLFSIVTPVIGTNRFRFWTNLSFGALPYLHLGPITNGATGVTNLTVYFEIPK